MFTKAVALSLSAGSTVMSALFLRVALNSVVERFLIGRLLEIRMRAMSYLICSASSSDLFVRKPSTLVIISFVGIAPGVSVKLKPFLKTDFELQIINSLTHPWCFQLSVFDGGF